MNFKHSVPFILLAFGNLVGHLLNKQSLTEDEFKVTGWEVVSI